MNLATTILRDVSAAGGMIAVRDGRLKLSAPKPLPMALIERIREAKPILLAALQVNVPFWKMQYHRLIILYEGQGISQNESEWRAMNETFLQCCKEHAVPCDSDAGYYIMRSLITATDFNPIPTDCHE